MKVRLITLLSVFLLIGCNGNETKNKDVIKLKSQTEKSTKKTLSKQKNILVIDDKGVANVVITTNDAMKFDINKININVNIMFFDFPNLVIATIVIIASPSVNGVIINRLLKT